VEKVGTDLIKSKRIVFTPSVDIKKELAATSINITCYDRNGQIVKRITTEGGDVEDGEDDSNTGNSGSQSQNGDNTNQGSNTSQGGDEPFDGGN
jgi:hypothetical protein